MLVLGIDPGSITSGWALLETKGRKIEYVGSGVLEFDKKAQFLERLTQIKEVSDALVAEVDPDEIALESLIFVKSPTSLIKLAQTRGIILSSLVEKYKGRIFEYSPNLIKSTAVGHGHADKESVKKFLDMTIGKREYKTHDESDAVAIALCHILNKEKNPAVSSSNKTSGKGLAAAVSHKIKE